MPTPSENRIRTATTLPRSKRVEDGILLVVPHSGQRGVRWAIQSYRPRRHVVLNLRTIRRSRPLDLRAVDDAVSEHPAVRDVALIDYDGRKATLKVWVEDTATPAEVHTALVQKAIETFGPDNEVTVVALDDAA